MKEAMELLVHAIIIATVTWMFFIELTSNTGLGNY